MTASFFKSRTFVALAMAGAMGAVNAFAPSIGGAVTPTFKIGQTYRDGLGRRRKIPAHPKHNSRRGIMSKRDFFAAVRATHSDKPDPRDVKYLHSYAAMTKTGGW